jgi:hypothetical protein
MPYSDGTYTSAVQNGPKRTFYPFLNSPTKDSTTKGTVRNYVVLPGSYSPAAALTTDPDDATQYLIEESELSVEGGVGRFARTFCKVPGTQTVPTSVAVSKPQIPGDDTFPKVIGSYLVTQPDTTLPRFDAYYRQTVTSDTGAPGFYPTGGTYTLTFAGNTTGALNYNDSAATVETALDALTSVNNRGGCTVTGSYNSAGGLVVTFASYAQITIASGSLTGTGTLTEIESLSNSGYSQTVGAYFVPTAYTPTADMSLLTYSFGAPLLSTSSPSSNIRQYEIFLSPYGGNFTGGTYTLTINGNTTSAIAYNSTFAQVATALNNLGIGTFSVVAGLSSGTSTPLSSDARLIQAQIIFEDAPPTGGTFTLTVGADTTASIDYDATASEVQTALNLLTSVTNRGGCTVSGEIQTGFAIAFANAVMTANSASLTPAGSTATPSITDGSIGRTQKIVFASSSATRDLYCANHGLTTANTLFLKSGSTYYAGILGSKFIVPDANTIRLLVAASDDYAAAGTITELGGRTKASYQPGSVLIPGSQITNFYLPGVTSGITTAADIPIPSSAANDTDLLLAIFSGSSTINTNVGQLQPWRGPILSLTYEQVSAANV